jgi:hypothetical protein
MSYILEGGCFQLLACSIERIGWRLELDVKGPEFHIFSVIAILVRRGDALKIFNHSPEVNHRA